MYYIRNIKFIYIVNFNNINKPKKGKKTEIFFVFLFIIFLINALFYAILKDKLIIFNLLIFIFIIIFFYDLGSTPISISQLLILS